MPVVSSQAKEGGALYGGLITDLIVSTLADHSNRARCKARTVFARLNTWIVGSNPIRGTVICVVLYRQWPYDRVNPPSKGSYSFSQNPWPESASELYWPSDRRLSAKLMPIFADRGLQRDQRDGSLRPYIQISIRFIISELILNGNTPDSLILKVNYVYAGKRGAKGPDFFE
jgi:hypothetical protein